MPGFEKDHYLLTELAERWQRPLRDIKYHTERNRLEVQIWLGDVLAMRHILMKTADGEEFPVPKGVTTVKGYHIVDGDELRKIYRTPGIPEIRKFHSLDQKEIYTFYPTQEGLKISIDALEVSHAECARFEISHRIHHPHAPKQKARATSTPSGGRPSFMKPVIQHFENRAARGRLRNSLSDESLYLEAWAHKKLGVGAPVAKTIANKIGASFTSHKAADARA